MIGIEHKRTHNAGDVEQLVGCLRSNGARNGVFNGCDGDLVAVQPRGLHDLIAGKRGVQVALEELFDIHGICARTAQECGRFKCTRARAHGKILRIEYDACKKSLRLDRTHVALVDGVLQKLRHKLGCR